MKIGENSTDRRYNILKDCGASLIGLGAGYEIRKQAPKYLRPVFSKSLQKYACHDVIQNNLIRQKLDDVLKTINSTLPENKKIQIRYIDGNFKTNNRKLEAVKRGLNACFYSNNRTVFLNKNNPAPGFHELGHAKDFIRGIMPVAQKAARVMSKPLGIALPVFAVFTQNVESTPDKPLKPIENTTNFIRNNIGKISAVSMLPILAIEISANFQGNKMARKADLPVEILKKVRNTHRLSNISYLTGTLLLAVSSSAAVKIKDYIYSKV